MISTGANVGDERETVKIMILEFPSPPLFKGEWRGGRGGWGKSFLLDGGGSDRDKNERNDSGHFSPGAHNKYIVIMGGKLSLPEVSIGRLGKGSLWKGECYLEV